MFIDASALIAMLTDDEEGDAYAKAMASAEIRLTSVVALWEVVAALVKSCVISTEEAHAKVAQLISAADITLVPIGERELTLAAEAFANFGKGRHPARLNMGDCFAYACARSHDVPLLFADNEFSATDIKDAKLGAPAL
jgi:ribonuclease VapC